VTSLKSKYDNHQVEEYEGGRGRKRRRKSSKKRDHSQNSTVSDRDDSTSVRIRETSLDGDSLERMHTFSLKLSVNQSTESTGSRIRNVKQVSERRKSIGSEKKAFCIEQNTKVLEAVIKQTER
jgi:hypothetical protein